MKTKLTVSREFTFDAAHRLTFHEGACANLHGHTWKGIIEVYEDPQTASDMIVDFGQLKEHVEYVLSKYDHKLLFYMNDIDLKSIAIKMKTAYLEVPMETTAENLVHLMAEDFDKVLPEGIKIASLTLWETPKNSCKLEYV